MRQWKDLPLVSAGLVICNVIVYICCLLGIGNLEEAGCLDAYAVLREGEYGRIIWSMFLHGSTQHLFSNMLILFFMGAMIEKETGHLCYGFLYFLSGIGGGLLSLYMKVRTGDFRPSIGASGAVFGLDGVLMAMVLFWDEGMDRVTPQRVIFMIMLSLYSGLMSNDIDNAGHIGGLFTGFLAGCAMCMIHRARKRMRQ